MIQPNEDTAISSKKPKQGKPNWPEIEAAYLAGDSAETISKEIGGASPCQIRSRICEKGLTETRKQLNVQASKAVTKRVLSIADEVGFHISNATRNLAKEMDRRSKKLKDSNANEFRTLVETLKSLTQVRSEANPENPTKDAQTSAVPVNLTISFSDLKRSDPKQVQVIDVQGKLMHPS